MRLLKFCKYFYYIKKYFNKLPEDIQNELVGNMSYYYDLARISRFVDL